MSEQKFSFIRWRNYKGSVLDRIISITPRPQYEIGLDQSLLSFCTSTKFKNELRYIKIIMIYIAWVTCKISRLQVTLTNRNFFVFEELTCAYLHQVALSILLLPVQNYLTVVTELTRVQFAISTCKFFKDVNIAWVCRAVKILSYPSLYLMYIIILNFLNKPFEICFVFVF